MNKKLKYLERIVRPEVIDFLNKNSENIPKKIFVWVGMCLNKKLNATQKHKPGMLKFWKKNVLSSEPISIFQKISIEIQGATFTVDIIEAIGYIYDWFAVTSPNISQLTMEEAYISSCQWHKELEGICTDEQYVEIPAQANVFYELDGYRIVEIKTKYDLDTEGHKMGHCVGGYYYRLNDTFKILSLRDSDNEPHVTISMRENKVREIKGKCNRPPVEKYAQIIVSWLLKSGLDISECYDLQRFPKDLTIYDHDAETYEKYQLVAVKLEESEGDYSDYDYI